MMQKSLIREPGFQLHPKKTCGECARFGLAKAFGCRPRFTPHSAQEPQPGVCQLSKHLTLSSQHETDLLLLCAPFLPQKSCTPGDIFLPRSLVCASPRLFGGRWDATAAFRLSLRVLQELCCCQICMPRGG